MSNDSAKAQAVLREVLAPIGGASLKLAPNVISFDLEAFDARLVVWAKRPMNGHLIESVDVSEFEDVAPISIEFSRVIDSVVGTTKDRPLFLEDGRMVADVHFGPPGIDPQGWSRTVFGSVLRGELVGAIMVEVLEGDAKVTTKSRLKSISLTAHPYP